MDSDGKKRMLLPILFTIIILSIVFALVLFFLNKKGYLSFERVDDACITNVTSNQNETINSVIKAESNMTIEEVFLFGEE